MLSMVMLFVCGCAPYLPQRHHLEGLTPSDGEIEILTWNVYNGDGNVDDCLFVLRTHNAHIVHLQEARRCYETLVYPYMIATDYILLNEKIGKNPCSTPVLYNAQKLEVLESGVELLKMAYSGSTSKTVAWAVFRIRESGKTFVDINFHGAKALAKYEEFSGMTEAEIDSIGDAWHVDNVTQILSIANAVSLKWGSIPVVITGDCNFDSSDEAYELLTEAGYYDAEVEGIYAFTSDGYRTWHALNDSTLRPGASIDRIFGSEDVYFIAHEIDRSEGTVTASDHFPVVAQLYFNI